MRFLWCLLLQKKSVFNAKNENFENAQNAENSHQNFDCCGVIQQSSLASRGRESQKAQKSKSDGFMTK